MANKRHDERAPLKIDIRVRLLRPATERQVIDAIRAAGQGARLPGWIEVTAFDWTHGKKRTVSQRKISPDFAEYLQRAVMVVKEK